jgi:hypothetical protein
MKKDDVNGNGPMAMVHLVVQGEGGEGKSFVDRNLQPSATTFAKC